MTHKHHPPIGKSALTAVRIALVIAVFMAGNGTALYLALPKILHLWAGLPTWHKVLYCFPPLGPVGILGYTVGKAHLWDVLGIMIVTYTFSIALLLFSLNPLNHRQ
jgi:hypothetical protein